MLSQLRDVRPSQDVAPANRLRVGIPALVVRPEHNGGGEVALRELIRGLQYTDPDMELFVFVRSRSMPLFSRAPKTTLIPVRVPGGRLSRAVRFAWENTWLHLAARQLRFDVTLFPFNLVPAKFPTRTVLLTYDFSSLFYREYLPHVRLPFSKRILDFERIFSCRRADAIVTASRFTAREIVRIAAVPEHHIHVVPLGVRKFEAGAEATVREVVAQYGVEGKYILAVASLMPHKNLPRLIAAFAERSDQELRLYQLVLVGKSGGYDDAIHTAIQRFGLAERVILTGFVPDAHLPAFYRAADIFVLPSLYEGFGLPVLEAAACGTAVAAARSGSLPEIIGDAGLLFDPVDVPGMAAVLARLAQSEMLRTHLGEKGRRWAAQFSWGRTAAAVAEVLKETAHGQKSVS